MKPQSVYCMRILMALLTLAAVSGCAGTKTAKLKTWRAAEFDVTGVERLAVMGFRAPPEVAPLVEQSAVERLRNSRFYHVLHDGRGQPGAKDVPLPDDPDGLHQIVVYGRRLGADAVLVGQAQRDMDLGTQLGGVALRVGDPKLAVRIDYFVVDTYTGEVRGQGKIARRKTEAEFARDGGWTEQTPDNFVRQCVDEMVSQMTAGSSSVRVDLARLWIGKGSEHIDQGNELAAKGEWGEAERYYRAALKANPDSHQALYNLGLTAEAQGRFDEARKMFDQAIAKSSDPLYRAARSRADHTRVDYQLARRQILGRPRHRFVPRGASRIATQPAPRGFQQTQASVAYGVPHRPMLHSETRQPTRLQSQSRHQPQGNRTMR